MCQHPSHSHSSCPFICATLAPPPPTPHRKLNLGDRPQNFPHPTSSTQRKLNLGDRPRNFPTTTPPQAKFRGDRPQNFLMIKTSTSVQPERGHHSKSHSFNLRSRYGQSKVSNTYESRLDCLRADIEDRSGMMAVPRTQGG